MSNITEKYTATIELIQNEMKDLKSKQELLAYLTAVKNFVTNAMQMARMLMKGYK